MFTPVGRGAGGHMEAHQPGQLSVVMVTSSAMGPPTSPVGGKGMGGGGGGASGGNWQLRLLGSVVAAPA